MQTAFFARRRNLPSLQAQPVLDEEGQRRFEDQTSYLLYGNLAKTHPDHTRTFVKQTLARFQVRMDPSDGVKHAQGYYVALEDIRDYIPQHHEVEHEDGSINDYAVGLAARLKRESSLPTIAGNDFRGNSFAFEASCESNCIVVD